VNRCSSVQTGWSSGVLSCIALSRKRQILPPNARIQALHVLDPTSVPRLPDEWGGCLLCYRFIPACAGNTEVVSFGHPTDSGSSPRVLGTGHILFSFRRQAAIAHGQQKPLDSTRSIRY
jgi:hypothetical protein